MFSLTEDHFANHALPASEYGIRRPFFFWLEQIAVFFGQDRADRALDLLVADYDNADDIGRLLMLDTPKTQLELFFSIFDRSASNE